MIYDYAEKIAQNIWGSFGRLWYFLVAGVIVSALISVYCPEQKLAVFSQKLRQSNSRSIAFAAAIGIISPIPTYTTIPLLATLVRAGSPTPPLFAFLVSSPLMNPALFSLTLGAFGYQMAVGRVIATLFLGVAAGYAMQLLIHRNRHAGFIRDYDSVIKPKSESLSFLRQCYGLAKFSIRYFLLGIVVAALIKVLIPAEWILNILGKQRSLAIPISSAAGIPLYTCGGGAIPIMQSLRDLGMDKGAILAFFISGPATKISTLIALKAAITKEAFILYLITVFAGALLFGFIFSIW